MIAQNLGMLFSQIELFYFQKVEAPMDLDQTLDLMEVGRKKDLNQLSKIYLSFMKSYLAINDKMLIAINHKAIIQSEIYIPKIIEDLKLIMEIIQNYEDRQDQYPSQLALVLNWILATLTLIIIQSKNNCYRVIENLLLKLIKFSLKIIYIPLKKVMIIFLVLLQIELNEEQPSDGQYWLKMSEYQKAIKQPSKFFMKNASSTEQFYRRLILSQDENQMGQIIVVGLLRGLVKTAGSVSNNQQGVDIHREWEEYYLNDSKLASADYSKYKEQSNQQQDLRTQKNEVIDEFDRHRIVLNYAITEFLLLFLKQLRNNCKVQCSYLIQLITDANGVLVFLKFFEKFNPQSISSTKIDYDQIMCKQFGEANLYYLQQFFRQNQQLPYRLQRICNGIVKFQLAIKKFPGMFPENKKIKKYSHLLLKIQILNFNKKNLKLGNTMKLISEVYCKYKQNTKNENKNISKQDQLLDSLYKFEKCQDKIYNCDITQSQEELRKLHLDHNNYHYNNTIDSIPVYNDAEPNYKQNDYLEKLQNQPIDHDFISKYEEWLEENVWDYYD
ncbi:unnamed protein product (macronuclear) [Paramecium tetraurelia]|uniref:Far11/STRP C-terminal domain-containing protein n=1 Tax=Paramecium tetraurelia TaxID=5888 RepID=A0CIR7_PARTE|nr:uncharacterized protein GSPATT00007819001 [Paramecium tetraurelia]CAK70684.1 unnamed protein product [Paramecium tetraurelia]|eukprot:XP_001438081.1 hypothetical protein (macronuclear) [Paramecium tetraurelia strain d4-2]